MKKLVPHIIAFAVLFILSFGFFAPQAFNNKVLRQSDNMQSLGMQQEARKYLKETGHVPLWTNAMFSGMPTYQILFSTKNLIKYASKGFLLGNNMSPPHTSMLLMMLGFYFLLIVMGVDWRIGIIGAFGFGLATNHPILFDAGHSTKLIAMAYMAPILAGVLLTFRGKYLLGGGLTALFVATQIYANHIQITYYFFITLIILGIVYLIYAIKDKTLPSFFKAVAVLIPIVLLAVATNTSRLWTTYEYSKETIRGKSELTKKSSSSGSLATEEGLSKDYAFDWSYGKLETFNLLIPNFMGGSSSKNFVSEPNSNTLKALRQLKDNTKANQYARLASHYWGNQPFTSGPVYMGALLFLLFFLGAFLVKNPIKIWIIASVIFSIFIAWGKNFSGFNYFLFDHFPMFNKFRAVTMILGITNFMVVLLAALGLQEFFSKNISSKEKQKALYIAGGISFGLVILAFLISSGLDYGTGGKDLPDFIANALIADRAALLKADLFRTFIFIFLGFGVLFAFLKMKFKPVFAIIAIGLIALIDLWTMGRRFVNKDAYVNPSETQQYSQAQDVDKKIMADKDIHYRVADFRGNPFNNAMTSFHHKSTGGYHAAKLMRYQEMIEKYLSDPGNNSHIYGMLNAKYFITQDNRSMLNTAAAGNAWFVKEFEVVKNGDEEIEKLADFNPLEKAIIQEKYAKDLTGFNIQYDSNAVIKLIHYNPDTLIYKYTANTDQLTIFSEVYYPPEKGWKMYLDGKEIEPFTKANFILRAAKLPAGKDKELKMIFAPKSYYTGEKITLASSIIVFLLVIGGIVLYFKNEDFPSPENLPEYEEKPKRQKIRKTGKTKKAGKRKS